MNTAHSEENQTGKENAPLLKKLWFGLFILMYPVIITFSLLFTGVLLFFSTLSKIFSKIVELFSSRKPASGPDGQRSTPHEAEGTARPLE
jgi:hypothetical protein